MNPGIAEGGGFEIMRAPSFPFRSVLRTVSCPLAAAAVFAACGEVAAAAQEVSGEPVPVGEQILRGLESSFALPWQDLQVRRHNSEWRELLSGLTLTAAAGVPLSTAGPGGRDSGELEPSSPTAQLNLRYQPLGYWFANMTVYGYLRPGSRAPWNPDFTYSFGYDDWHPYTLSLVYSNYSNSRFDPRPGDPVTRLRRGSVSLGWKAPLPRVLARPFLIDDKLSIACRIGLNATPRYEQSDGSVGRWKQSAHLGCRYPFGERLFVDVTAFTYGRGQQPWDPDFTYGFGLFDWRPGRISIQYSNYSGNRFPWNARGPRTGRFRDGSVSISWSQSF
jgi:hypothetical protein